MPGFYQEAHSTRQVVATIAVDRVNLLQADAANLIKDASLNDRVELRVLGDVGAKIRVLNFDSPGVQVSILYFHNYYLKSFSFVFFENFGGSPFRNPCLVAEKIFIFSGEKISLSESVQGAVGKVFSLAGLGWGNSLL